MEGYSSAQCDAGVLHPVLGDEVADPIEVSRDRRQTARWKSYPREDPYLRNRYSVVYIMSIDGLFGTPGHRFSFHSDLGLAKIT